MQEFTIQDAIQQVVQRQDLSAEQMTRVMHAIMRGEASPTQIGGFLVAMRMKGETIAELVAAARVVRALAVPVVLTMPRVVDIVGTGGDQQHTFNISTASALVVAAAGGCVAKHGNRSVSSRCGSADVLEAAGVNLTLTAVQIAECVTKLGIGFMFAPQHHTAMRQANVPRKELGIRTFFNLLGALTNPANVSRQLLGVYAPEWTEPLAQVLQQLGCEHALVVHAADGLDEISIAGPTKVTELIQQQIRSYEITPEQFGFARASLSAIKVQNVADSLAMLNQVLQNTPGPARDIVALNAGAALYVAGLAENIAMGVTLALTTITSGAAYAKLHALIALSRDLAEQ